MEYNILNSSVLKWWQRHAAWQNRILISLLPALVTLCWLLSIKILLPILAILALLSFGLLCSLVLTKPQSALFILLFFDFFIYVLSSKNIIGLLPPQITWFSDALFILLFFSTLLSAIKTSRWKKTIIDLPVLFFLSIIILSAIANKNSLLATILGMRFYLKFPLFYIILVNLRFEPQTFQSYKKWFLGLTLLQVPFTIVEFFALGWRGDMVGGTMGPGGTTQLGLMCVLAQCLFLTYVIEAREGRLKYFMSAVILLIPPILGSVNANFLFLILLLGFIFVKKLLSRDAARMLLMIPLLILVLWGSLMVLNAVEPDNTAMIILRNPRTTWNLTFSGELTRSSSFNRLVQIPSAFRIAVGDPVTFLIGSGPYQYAEGSKVLGDPNALPGFRFLTQIGGNQIARTLLELGILGIIASVFLMGSVWWLIRNFIRAAVGEDQLLLGKSLELMWVFFAVLAPVYGPLWQMEHLAIPFWVWVASLSVSPAPE